MKTRREKVEELSTQVRYTSDKMLTKLSPLIDQLALLWLRQISLLEVEHVKDIDIRLQEIQEQRNSIINMIDDILGKTEAI